MYVNDKDFKRDLEMEAKASKIMEEISGVKPVLNGYELKRRIINIILTNEGNIKKQADGIMDLIRENYINVS